jgi:hypothetical protein
MRRERTELEFGPEAEIRQTPSDRLPSAFCPPEIDRTRVIHAVDARNGASSDRPLKDRFEGRPEFSAASQASFLRKDASSGHPLAPKATGVLANRCMSPSDPMGRATPKRLRSDFRNTFLAVSGVRSRWSLSSALHRKTSKRLQTDSCPTSACSVAHMAVRRYRRGDFETPAGRLLKVDAGY